MKFVVKTIGKKYTYRRVVATKTLDLENGWTMFVIGKMNGEILQLKVPADLIMWTRET